MADLPQVGARVVVEGGDQAAAEVQKLSKAFENAKTQTLAAGSALDDGGRLASAGLKQFGLHTLEAENGAARFRETLHVIHPVLDAAGLGIGNLGAFARVASAGLVGLTAAGIGAAIAGFAKLADQSGKAENHVSAAVGGVAAGSKTFADLQERAHGLGVEVGTLGDIFSSLYDAQKKGSGILIRAVPGKENSLPAFANPKRTADAGTALFESIAAGAASRDEAKTASAALASSIGEQKGLTLQGFQGLEKQSPGGALSLAKLLGQTDVSGFEAQLKSSSISLETLIARLQQVGPAAQAAFSQGSAPGEKFSDALRFACNAEQAGPRRFRGEAGADAAFG